MFKTAASLAFISCLMIAAPATAGTQSDIQTCRDAITAQGTYDISAHRLKFISKKDGRVRRLTLKAVPNKGGESFMVTCRINRKNLVVAINDKASTQLAQHQK